MWLGQTTEETGKYLKNLHITEGTLAVQNSTIGPFQKLRKFLYPLIAPGLSQNEKPSPYC